MELNFLVPLPEDIVVERISRVSEVKSIWRSGIKQIEEIFADHIMKINEIYDDKAMEYERVREKLITNHEFLKRFYIDMQKKLNEKLAKI